MEALRWAAALAVRKLDATQRIPPPTELVGHTCEYALIMDVGEKYEDHDGLLPLLQSKEWDVRFTAAMTLGMDEGGGRKPVLPALLALLHDDDVYVRVAAIWSLGQNGAGAKTAVPALSELLRDEDEQVRKAAADALERIEATAGHAQRSPSPSGRGPG